VHAFLDMHDVGDLLVRTGFADPVMDMEQITLTFADFDALARELHDSGGSTAVQAASGLRGRAFRHRLKQGYEAVRRDDRLPATFEIVYGHAWKPEQGLRVTAEGHAVVRVVSRPR